MKLVGITDSDAHETPSRPSKGSQQDRRIDIQPAEDEDGTLTYKQTNI